MSYKCEIIADSLSPQGNRLTTYVITYPRIVHAEMCRHRMLSRNTASSRAIPFAKMIKDVQENPFIPIAWQFKHKGMQGSEYVNPEEHYGEIEARVDSWLEARDKAVEMANDLDFLDTTKQLCNRLLEPFVWTTEIITGTEWANFFELRCPQYVVSGYPDGCNPEALEPFEATFRSRKDAIGWLPELENFTEIDWLECNESQAEIHIQKIAEMMWDARNQSTPKSLKPGEWHIPFGDNISNEKLREAVAPESLKEGFVRTKDYMQKKIEGAIKIATARCARISYLNFEGKDDYRADIKLHDRLMEMKHWSPFEHCARVMSEKEISFHIRTGLARQQAWKEYGWCRNFRGFIQYRHMVES